MYVRYPLILNTKSINKTEDIIDVITEALLLFLNSLTVIPNIKPNNNIINENIIKIPNCCKFAGTFGINEYPITKIYVNIPNKKYVLPIVLFLNISKTVNTK
jgi:hypothetical protein